MISFNRLIIFILLFQNSSLVSGTSDRWIGSILKETLPILAPPTANEDCFKDSMLYANHLNNETTWAVKMLDSSANSVSGILSGNSHHFGNFDQCLSINVIDFNIAGKYCLVKLRYWPTPEIYTGFYSNNVTVYEEPYPTSSVWRMLQVTMDPRFQRRDIIYVGVCMPSSCSSEDLQYSLQKQNKRFTESGIHVEFNATEEYCTVGNENKETSSGFYVYMGLFLALIVTVTISTGLHVYNEATDNPKDQWYYPLSALHNMRNMKKDVAKEHAPACGLKVLSMFIIIYGHRHLLSLYAPIVNMYQNEKRFGQFWETYILNGSIVVDTFFCATGFITFQKMLSNANKKHTSLVLYVFLRWIRISIIFISTVLFMAYVLPFVGSGPFWKYESYRRSEVCSKYWWVNLIYIGNYLHADKLCLIPAWYLAIDMQLFILSVILMCAYLKNKLFGITLLVATLCLAILLPGVIVFIGNFHGIFRFYIRYLKDYYFNKEYLNVYSSTLSRASPYVIGMVAAYLHLTMKKKNIIIPFWLHVIFAFSTLFITALCILFAWPFYLPDHTYNWVENALYAILSKMFWATNMCWIIMSNSIGGEDLLTSKILSSKIFVILNRLTLCALLVHTPLQFLLIMSIRTPQYLTHLTNVWMALGDISMSYCISFIVYLIVEAPLSGFLRQFLHKIL